MLSYLVTATIQFVNTVFVLQHLLVRIIFFIHCEKLVAVWAKMKSCSYNNSVKLNFYYRHFTGMLSTKTPSSLENGVLILSECALCISLSGENLTARIKQTSLIRNFSSLYGKVIVQWLCVFYFQYCSNDLNVIGG